MSLDLCALKSDGWACTEYVGHAGDHKARSAPSGPVLHRWAPTDPSTGAVTDHAPVPVAEAPQDHGPLAAHLSDRTLAKVLSRPAHVPRETPSLVELDRREAAERALAALVEWRKAGDVKAHIHATVALRKAADEYIEVQS